MAFFLSNNLDESCIAEKILMSWLQAETNLSLFIRLLSVGGTTSDVLKERIFGMAVTNGNLKLV
jgi:hypothetical protein